MRRAARQCQKLLDLTPAMSTDYGEKERGFIAALADDTGRDLKAWMAAIAQSGLSERNAIIDWLRHQGLQFPKASWLERIHHNGGQLIYGGVAERGQPQRGKISRQPTDAYLSADLTGSSPEPTSNPLDDQEIQILLASCKGLRPLAEHVLREVGRSVPGVQIYPAPPFVLMAAPLPFAALLPHSRVLRIYGEFGQSQGRVKAAESANRAAPPFSGMLLLDDARAIDREFHHLIRAAASR